MWEKLSPLSRGFHVLNNPSYKLVVFFFAILFVEYAVFLVFESYTAKKVITMKTDSTICDVCIVPARFTEPTIKSGGTSYQFITPFRPIVTHMRKIPRVICIIADDCILAVFAIRHFKRIMAVVCIE